MQSTDEIFEEIQRVSAHRNMGPPLESRTSPVRMALFAVIDGELSLGGMAEALKSSSLRLGFSQVDIESCEPEAASEGSLTASLHAEAGLVLVVQLFVSAPLNAEQQPRVALNNSDGKVFDDLRTAVDFVCQAVGYTVYVEIN